MFVQTLDKNGTDNNLAQKFDHLLTVGFLVVNNFMKKNEL